MNDIYRQLITELPDVAKKLHHHATIIEKSYTGFSNVVSRYVVNGEEIAIRQRHLQDNATKFLNLWERIVEW